MLQENAYKLCLVHRINHYVLCTIQKIFSFFLFLIVETMLQEQEQKYFTVICNIHTVVPFTFISSSEEYAKKSSIYFCSRFFVSCHLSPEAKPSGQSKFSHGWWAFNAFWIFSSNSYTKPVQHCRRGHLISVANFDNFTKF